MSTQISFQNPDRSYSSSANALSMAQLDAIVGGTGTAPAGPGAKPGNPNLLVVIAIIAILIG